MQMGLEDKDDELRRAQVVRVEEPKIRVVESEPSNMKMNALRMELEMAQGQLEQFEKDKNRYYSKVMELEK
jgi:hypothetical protein